MGNFYASYDLKHRTYDAFSRKLDPKMQVIFYLRIQLGLRSNDNFGIIATKMYFSFQWSIILQKSKMPCKTGFVQMGHK